MMIFDSNHIESKVVTLPLGKCPCYDLFFLVELWEGTMTLPAGFFTSLVFRASRNMLSYKKES